jgi:Domain of unknown function (DUF1835)
LKASSAIHIVAGSVSAGLLVRAGFSKLICLSDDLSCGPVLDFSDPDRWSARRQYWSNLTESRTREVQDDYEELQKNQAALSGCPRICLWVGPSVHEQLMLLWSVSALTHIGIEAGVPGRGV